jgi:hypothetical protein
VIGSPADEGSIQLDVYLDRMLAGEVLGPDDWRPSLTADADLPRIAALVADGATRFHPSFRFEERLAVRLRDAALGLDRSAVGTGVIVPFAPGSALDRARSRRVGGVLVGGAIASGVSIASLAGAAALVVWRRARWERLV